MKPLEIDPADTPTPRSRAIVERAYADGTRIRRPQTQTKRDDLRRAAMEWQRKQLADIIGTEHGAKTRLVEQISAYRPELGMTPDRLYSSLRKHRLLTTDEAHAIAHVLNVPVTPLIAHVEHMPWLISDTGDRNQSVALVNQPAKPKRPEKPRSKRTRRVLSVEINNDGVYTVRIKAKLGGAHFDAMKEALANTEHTMKTKILNGVRLVEITSTTDMKGAESLISAIYLPRKRGLFGALK